MRLRTFGHGAARFVVLLAAVALVTAAASLLLGALLRASALRSISLGFYGVGALLVAVGFFHSTRGLTRAADQDRPFVLGRSEVRWARPEEHQDALASSTLFVVLGAALLILGTILDHRYPLT
jgi:hypothetical protein